MAYEQPPDARDPLRPDLAPAPPQYQQPDAEPSPPPRPVLRTPPEPPGSQRLVVVAAALLVVLGVGAATFGLVAGGSADSSSTTLVEHTPIVVPSPGVELRTRVEPGRPFRLGTLEFDADWRFVTQQPGVPAVTGLVVTDAGPDEVDLDVQVVGFAGRRSVAFRCEPVGGSSRLGPGARAALECMTVPGHGIPQPPYDRVVAYQEPF